MAMVRSGLRPAAAERDGRLRPRRNVPDDLWVPCPNCRTLQYGKAWIENLKVCPACHYHARLSPYERVASLCDTMSFDELDSDLCSADPLEFRAGEASYREKLVLEETRLATRESLIYGRALIERQPVVLAVNNFNFLGGSMGVAMGEKITRAIELAIGERQPLVIVSASGGARMQEGVYSLMQMAKTTAALARLHDAGLPYVSILTDPTVGGVPASYAMLGDVHVAEPGAFIGFAGPRVIEQTTRQKLPANVDTAEFMLEHGMIDMVVSRTSLRATIGRLLRLYRAPATPGAWYRRERAPVTVLREEGAGRLADQPCADPVTAEAPHHAPPAPATAADGQSADAECPRPSAGGLTPWQKVQLARHPERPYTLDYLRWAFADFVELRGDRRYGDDPAILGGVARLGQYTVVVVGHQKGRGTKESVARNFGMARPEGFRKAQRLFRQAEKLGLPVITFVDTPGGSIGISDEERGQVEAIAASLATLVALRVPVLSVVTGEGGSGGALAIGIADRILMLEHAIYSVASPEAAAAILWRSASHAADAASAMGITAQELYRGGVVDEIIPEPEGGAHCQPQAMACTLAETLLHHLSALGALSMDELLAQRHRKYRSMGAFRGGEEAPLPS